MLLNDDADVFRARLDRFRQLTDMGQWDEADAIWQLLDPMGRDWYRAIYRLGEAELVYALFRFWQGSLQEDHLAQAEKLATAGRNRLAVRNLHWLRGAWRLERGEWALATKSLHEAIRMAREVGQTDAAAETMLTLARLHLGQLTDPRQEAEQLSIALYIADRPIAELWLAIGDHEQAKKHALAAYKWAWADGEPYLHRYELNKATAILKQLGAEVPNLPPYDPARDPKLPWEDEVEAAIARLRAEKEAEKQQARRRRR
jgi:hypothetical protein